jgi:hypothetical protein
LCEGQVWDDLCNVLIDFDFLQTKIGALTVDTQHSPPPATIFDLLRDFQNALTALPIGHPMREQVAALYRAIDKNSREQYEFLAGQR